MLIPFIIDPVAIDFGRYNLPFIGIIHFKIYWYGITYLVAFLGFYWMARYRTKLAALKPPLTKIQLDDFLFYGALGVILGGRIGYVLFYGMGQFLADPLFLLRVWDGGMSFHGGFLGVLFAAWLYARTIGKTFFDITDFIAPMVPFGLLCGRIGNFINAELWGRPTDLPWAMVFHTDPDRLPRHPSMLYEAALEGLALLIILWWFSSKPRPKMAVSGLFLIGYGVFRFSIEFVRVPDAHLSYLAGGWLTMGMVLTMPMIILGLFLMFFAYRIPAKKVQ